MTHTAFVMYYGVTCAHCLHTLKEEVLPHLELLRSLNVPIPVHLVDMRSPGEFARPYFLGVAPKIAGKYNHQNTSDPPVIVTPVYARVNLDNPYDATVYPNAKEWQEAIQTHLSLNLREKPHP